MGFIDDLKSGRPGLQLLVPEGWKVHEDEPRRAVVIDDERRVGWHLSHAPLGLDLRREFDAILRTDVERHARHAFAEQYAQLQLPPEIAASRPPLRTSDPAWPDWSPVISVDHVQIGGAPALLVLRRLVYEPAMEVVLATLLVPLQTGVCELTTFHRATETGQRETMLVNLAMQQQPGKRPDELVRALGQRHFDDPQHDEKFPSHPLTLVRRAVGWLLDPQAALLKVLAPMPQLPVGALALPTAESVITPPPRYVPVPAGLVSAPQSMVLLTRVLLDTTENPRVLDVWRLPEPVLEGADRAAKLLELARRSVSDWERQGATDLEVKAEGLSLPGSRAGAAVTVRMRIGGTPAASVSRWIADEDGRVFRIAVGAPGYVPVSELEAEADAVMQSWQRLRAAPRQAWLTSDERLRPPAAPKAD